MTKAPTQPAAATATADRIALMQTFVRIVEAGSLSAAAKQMGATQPTISRRLQTLERSLGVRLLQRSTHAMKLTEDGQRCFAGASELLSRWAAFESDLRGTGDEPEGLLRVVAPHAFGQAQLVPPLVAFLQRYPQVAVEWQLRDDLHSMLTEGIDCAIQVGEVSDPSAVAIRISEVQRIVVGPPSLARSLSPVKDASELADLPWVALQTYYRNEVTLTHERSGKTCQFEIRPRMSTDSLYAMRAASVAGLGVCIASAWMVADELAAGRLVHLAPGWQAAPLPVYLTYPHASFYPAKLRRFVDAMREAMPRVVDLGSGRP